MQNMLKNVAVLFVFFYLLLIQLHSAHAKETVAPLDLQKAAEAARIKDPAAATNAYLEAVPEGRRAKTKAYAHGNYVLNVVDFLYSAAILLALLAFGWSRKMKDLALRLTRFRPLQTAFYWVQFLVLITLLGFPLTLYRSYFREKAYGLLTQDFSGWMGDQLKGLLLGCILGAILFVFLYGVLRRTQRTWWIWASVVLIIFSIIAIAIAPVFIEPVFNKFTPLHSSPIRDEILSMARANHIPANEVYEVDASRRTDRISAYVNGALGTTRIVIFDNTLRRCTPDEIKMIMGHEMGHYVLNHVWKGIAYFSVLIVIGLLFVRWGFAYATRRWPELGIENVADIAGLPLLVLLLSIFLFLTSPISNTVSRTMEHQADNFGLEAGRIPDAEATTFLKLGEYRELDPAPIIEVLFFDHPAGRSRILNAMEWKARHM